MILDVIALSIAVTLSIITTLFWLGMNFQEISLLLILALVCPISTVIAVGYVFGPELWSRSNTKKT